jgi:lipopolysaccharide transport system permease protein
LARVMLRPLLTMIFFTVFFSHRVHLPICHAPYSVFILAAFVPRTYFPTTVGELSGGLLEHQSIITRAYFPPLIISLSSLIAGLIDLVLAAVVLGITMAFFCVHAPPSWRRPFS